MNQKKTYYVGNILETVMLPYAEEDLNPIEHLWIDVKQGVRAANPKNSDELWQAATNTWDNISLSRCRTLIASMKSRCINHGFGGFPDLRQVKVLSDNFVLILSHRSILTSSNKLARKEKKGHSRK